MLHRNRSNPNTVVARRIISQVNAQLAVSEMITKMGPSVILKNTRNQNRDGTKCFRAGVSVVGEGDVVIS